MNRSLIAFLSPRKWKTKLKEWGYEKHLSKSQMKSIVAKVEKRLRDEGKDTVIFHNGVKMPVEKLENFKRRKTVRQSEPVSLVAGMVLAIFFRGFKIN
jgi:hypothetical protein